MNHAAFTHKPKRLDGMLFHPIHTKALWAKVWDEAHNQDWWQDNIGCVGNQDGYFYFQIPGLTTGFARIKIV